jgi:hypothetical protein
VIADRVSPRSLGDPEAQPREITMTKQADLKRRVRVRMAKTGESYATARTHVLAERPDPGRGGEPPRGTAPLHLTNGDATVPGLRGTGLADTIVPWRDVLHEGPVPDVPDEELRRIRAAFLARGDATDVGTATAFAERDRTLEAHREGEYVLWFEADLYDQLQLIQILARLHELNVPPTRITLICIGEHLGVAHFGGLSELTSEQLAQLPTTAATTLTTQALEHATSAWAALRAREPSGLNRIAATASPELRFLAEAFDRLSREYPSTRDGLSLSERRILAAVAESATGAARAGEAFVRTGAREARPFLGDTWCFDRMASLAEAPTPLLQAEPATSQVDRHSRLRLTEAGRQVLDGHADHVALNGVERWIGGVHLSGRDIRWRWDEGTESIVAGAA